MGQEKHTHRLGVSQTSASTLVLPRIKIPEKFALPFLVTLFVKWGYYFLLHRLIERIQCHNKGKTWRQGLALINVSFHSPNSLLSIPVISYVEIQSLVSFLPFSK